MNYPIVALASALAMSLAGNAALTHVYLGARDDRTQAVSDRDSARVAGQACSDATDQLADDARRQALQAAADLGVAAGKAQALQGVANKLLQAKPKGATDCQSAQIQMDEWLSTRARK